MPLADLAAQPAVREPAEWTSEIRRVALAGGADIVGITRVQPQWVFEGFEVRVEQDAQS